MSHIWQEDENWSWSVVRFSGQIELWLNIFPWNIDLFYGECSGIISKLYCPTPDTWKAYFTVIHPENLVGFLDAKLTKVFHSYPWLGLQEFPHSCNSSKLLQLVPNLQWFGLQFFDFTVVWKWCTFNRNHIWNSEFWYFHGLVICGTIPLQCRVEVTSTAPS